MSKKSKGLTVTYNGEETSVHALIINANRKWKESMSLMALEKFLKSEAKKKTSEVSAILNMYGIRAEHINLDTVKTVLKKERLVYTTGKKAGKNKTVFSVFSFLKDLQEYAVANDITKLVGEDRETLQKANDERLKVAA